ncbi:lantibiotic dehydratase C-terminal domain-containing protein [Herbiconiux sp. P16]|uniref:lantibiotic dehydratase C-terminal domain-containing protein n=1 Tax=Herbiconiux wuyangfengii TaxID=3342794 RepID=UPI0035BB0C6A
MTGDPGFADADWLYWNVYPKAGPQLDHAVRLVGAELVQPHIETIQRWFFIRFLDGRGPHLRVRIRADRETLDAITARRDHLTSALEHVSRETRSRDRFFGRSSEIWNRWPMADSPAIHGDFYEPERSKWGDGADLLQSEDVFAASSCLALAMITSHTDRQLGSARLPFATRVAHDAAVAFAGPSNARQILLRHSEWWKGPAGGTINSSRIDEATTEKLRAATLAGYPEGIDLFARPFLTAIHGLAAPTAKPRRSPLYRFHHHLHLQLNRLGVYPLHEAVVAEAAARLSEVPADSGQRRMAHE